MIVLISTYNRPEMCQRLVNQVIEQAPDAEIIVVDDGSEEPYQLSEVTYFRATENHGKRRYWQLVNFMFKQLESRTFDYVLKLDDDLILKPNAIAEAVRIYESIPEPKLALNVLADSRLGQACWTGVKGECRGEYWRVGWIDMIWLATRKLFDALKWEIREPNTEIWEERPNASSQVGKQISLRLSRQGGFYQVHETLVHHGGHDSLMNPIERKQTPLIV